MATLLVKSLGVAAGIGGLTATGVGIIYLTSDSSEPKKDTSKQKADTIEKQAPVETIADFLKTDKKVLLSTAGSEPEWGTNWTKFKEKYNNDNIATSSWAFQDWNQALKGNIAIVKFKEQCKTNSEKINAKTDPLYEDVKNYCTKDLRDE